MQKRVENILKEVAEEQGVPYEVVKAVYESQAMCSRLKMAQGEYGEIDTYFNVRWRNFGSFIVKPGRLAIIHKHGINSKSNKNIQE